MSALGAVVLASAVASSLGLALARGAPGIDFWQMRAAPLAVANGLREDVYSARGRRAVHAVVASLPRAAREETAFQAAMTVNQDVLGYVGVENVNTPFLYTVFSAFTWPDYEAAYVTYVLLSLACFLAGSYGVARMAGHARDTSALAVGVVALTFQAYQSELRVANVNQLQLGAVALFLWLQGRDGRALRALGGAVLALAVAFKPNLALVAIAVAVVWATDGRWRHLAEVAAGLVAGAVAALVLPAVLFGGVWSWSDWLAVVPQLVDTRRAVVDGNVSLAAVVLEVFGADVSRFLLLISLAAIALAARCGRRQAMGAPAAGDGGPRQARRTLLAASLGCAAMILSARLVWLHYYVLMVPLALVLLRLEEPGAPSARLARGALAAFAITLLTSATRFLWFIGLEHPAIAIAAVHDVGALLLAALGLLELRGRPRCIPGASAEGATVA